MIMDEDEALSGEDNYLDKVIASINREVVFKGDTYNLRFTHLVKKGHEYMLLSNEGMEEISFEIELKGYNILKIYDPYSGEETYGNQTSMTLKPYSLMTLFIGEE